MDYDLVVIGGGAAGLGAARAAIHSGARTLLVDAGPIGGDCTFTGCVPSKTLIEAAHRGAGFDAAMTAVRRAIDTIARTEDAGALRAEGIDVLRGWARLHDPHAIEVDGRRVTARHIVLATGAGPKIPGIPGLADIPYLTNETVFDLRALPESLVVLGGGPIGCELAQAFARLGSEVTVVEAFDRLLPGEDPEASSVLEQVLRRQGIDVRVGAPIARVRPAGAGAELCFAPGSGDPITAAHVLVATGRRPFTGGLDPDAAGVRLDPHGFVEVDAALRTSAHGVYAVGDVTGRSMLTHSAFAMGRIAATNARHRFLRLRFHPEAIPRVTYTSPEIAQVGITEAEAVEVRGAQVMYVPLDEVDRAITAGDTDGFVKIIAGPRPLLRNLAGGRILGATIVAPRAGEMIHELVLAIEAKVFPVRLAITAHAYPTWSVGIQQAVGQLFTEVNGRRARPPHSA
ncbi:MAG: FAD-dependent oxidoreductase [Acidimicrobiia bacterium]